MNIRTVVEEVLLEWEIPNTKLSAILTDYGGAGAYKRPEVVVCLKNHKKSPERAMLYLSEPVDRDSVAEPCGIFFEAKKCRLLGHMRR